MDFLARARCRPVHRDQSLYLAIRCDLHRAAFSWALTSRARQAEHRARLDPLTDLPNRFALEMVSRESGRFSRKFAAVVQIDLDGFKHVNDTLGHAAGDHVLRVVAKRIGEEMHGEGRVYRIGGDEFVGLVFHKRKTANLVAMANRVIAAASQPIAFRGQSTGIGASVGLALARDTDTELSSVMERADSALYDAKRAGKGIVKFSGLEAERAMLAQSLAESVEQRAAA
ncbi:MAG: GGDEF domain-containing protein [Pseudomonadota bacterium]